MNDWLKLQKDLYQDSRSEVAHLLGRKPLSLQRYEKVFLQDQKFWKDSSFSSFVSALNKSDFFFLGDFHTLRQSQRTLLRLLRDPQIMSPKVLALEVIRAGSEEKILGLLKKGRLSQVRELLAIERRFGSAFETYQEILEICIRKKIKLIGLSSNSKTLSQRDQFAANLIAKETKVWILFGEHHCARPHLPALVAALHPRSSAVVLQQNDDRLSLQRLSLLQKKSQVLKAPIGKFPQIALFNYLHTPVWMKWQSFLEWHLHSPEDYQSEFTSQIDAREQMLWCLRTLYDFLEDARYPLDFSFKELSDVEVFESAFTNFDKRWNKFGTALKRSLISQLRISPLAVAVVERKIFLAEVTVNSCAHAAASYLLRRSSQIDNDDQDFFVGTFVEAMSFFLSKILNHSRRAHTWSDWTEMTKNPRFKKEALAVLTASQFPLRWQQSKRWLRSLGIPPAKLKAHLGRILADALFEAFLAGEFSKARLLRLMMTPIHHSQDAFERLVELKSVGSPFASGSGKSFPR